MTSLHIPGLTRTKTTLLGGCAVLLTAAASSLTAQTTYTVVDLTANAPGTYGMAYAASGGQVAGAASAFPSAYVGAPAVYFTAPHAALWTGNGVTDLHPTPLLGGDVNSSSSMALGFAGGLQVGTGFGPNTQSRNVALAWRDTAASAMTLATPFAASSAVALGTDGAQIVGWASPTTGKGLGHALVWNAATGAATDLGDGGSGAFALGVARGQQVGYTNSSKGSAATLWNGTSRSQVVIHPKNANTSQALATDGSRQVGFSTLTGKAPGEPGNHGPVTVQYSSATVWSGTAASAQVLGSAFTQSYATGINGSSIVGYGYNGQGVGATTTYHALVWSGTTLQSTDLNVFLPSGFTGAMANAVDAQGNVAGTIFTADGQPHAAVWQRNP